MDNVEGLSTMHSLPKELAQVFAEESKCDPTLYGFTEDETGDQFEHASLKTHTATAASFEEVLEIPEPPVKKKKTASERSGGARQFTLRVSLRLRSQTPQSNEEDGEVTKDEEPEVKEELAVRKMGTSILPRKRRRVKFEEEEEKAVASVPVTRESDSEEDSKETFLSKRDQNIKDNKAMLAQLMADLQKMPGGAGILNNPASSQKPKKRRPKPPRSSTAPGELRRNSERVARRQTRSMGHCEEAVGPDRDPELELSLEDELLEVRHPPRSRAPRPSQTKPHLVRPVEDITELELQMVADIMTEKVYNRVTGTTCHQCRQKTIDTKTCCRSQECRGIHGQFCGPCLKNRYGEEVKNALLDPVWRCPVCRGICNCSFCRQREGRCPTGILFPLAQFHGFSDVHSYLSSLRDKLKSGTEEEDL